MNMRGVVDDTTPGREWWRNAVIYQLYVRSFGDDNGDGAGDLHGIISRLDYLERLGIDGIWLNPCYPSPQHDHGYDVSDYFDIEPAYGTLQTFDELVTKANARGIRIMMDVVPNHCSNEHAWFKAALASPRGSAERARFYFVDGKGKNGEIPPNNWKAVFAGSAWTRITEPDGTPGQWYLHTFTPQQPDLRADHPDVLAHFRDMFRFWFDRGVDGFRVDAIMVMGKEPGLPDATEAPAGTLPEDTWQFNRHTIHHPSLFPVVAQWRQVFDDYQREHGRVLVSVSEAYTPRKPENLLRYIGPTTFHQSFTFDLLLEPWSAEHMSRAIESNYAALHDAGASFTWTLNNHDVQRIVTRFGRADARGFYTGNNLINSAAPVDLALGTMRARAALMLMLALPGCTYLYMGEELGLPEVLDLPDARREDPLFSRTDGELLGRDGCRVPMPWTVSAARSFGFSARETSSWLPQPSDWGGYSVEAQENDPGSMLAFYRAALALRPTFVRQGDRIECRRDGDVLVISRGTMTVAVNFGDRPAPLDSTLASSSVLLASGELVDGAIAGNSALWVRRD
jgi:alpha-glucosidase